MTVFVVHSTGCYWCGEGDHVLGVFDEEHKALAEEVTVVGMYSHSAWVEEVVLNEPWNWYISPHRNRKVQL